ncbi:recombinase family protein [Bacteroidia bacterium]|nr:recombinase family protein [Bacteroidia bacterium]MDA9214097.1 recombinase family protein [Bacteroidia bacterium]
MSIETTKLWDSNYSDYQQYLFDRIRGLKENFLTPMGYRKISNLLNDEGLKTPRGTSFTNTKVHSIYKKGLIREERVNRKDIVLRSSTIIEPFKVLSNGILKSVHPPYVEEPKFPVPLKDD